MKFRRFRAAVLSAIVLVTSVVAIAPAAAEGGIGPASEADSKTKTSRKHAKNGPAEEGSQYIPGQLLVGYEAGVATAARADTLEDAGTTRIRKLLVPRIELVKTPEGMSVEEAVARFESDPRVRFAEPNYIVSAASTPNDPFFSELWGQNNIGQTVNGDPGTPDADIDAPEAWVQETGDSDVVVAVADTGVAFEHPDLAGNKWINAGETPGNGVDDDGNGKVDDVNGYDFIDDDGDPSDYATHGTHVAGTIGAVGDDGFGVNGVAWDVSLMGVRVLGSGGNGSYEGIANGFFYAGAEGADVVNASLGGGGDDSIAASIKTAIDTHPDTLYVVAAGNEANNNETEGRYPCNISSANLLCVAATDNDDALADFSNYGSTKVDMGAPGVTIKSTIPSSVQFGPTYSFEGTGSGSGDNWQTLDPPNGWVYTSETASSGSYSISDSSYNAAGESYPANANSWADTPPLNLSGQRGCDINYDLMYDLENGYDFLHVETSNDGVTWVPTGKKHTGWSAWMFESHSAPIDKLDGDSQAWVRFRLTSDAATQYDGVYLDNVRVECLDTPNSLDYDYYNGTSMATPQVAGAAAILFSANPSASVAEVKSTLMNTGDSLPALAGKTVSGKRLNLKNALDAIGTGEPEPTVAIEDAARTEGDSGSSNMSFDVTRSGTTTGAVTVGYTTANGTAESGSDYTTTNGTVTFNGGETAKTVTVPVLGDTVDESNETFSVTLNDPTDATLGDAQATGTIQDDDGEGGGGDVQPPTLLKPTAKVTKKKTIALKWTHDSMTATFDVEARRALYNSGFGAPQIVKNDISGDATKFTGVEGATYCFKMTATDGGTTSAFSNEKCTTIPLDDRSLKAGTGWGKKTGTGYFLNTYAVTQKKGKSLSLNGVQGQEISLVVEKCSGCGKVKVFFNGAVLKEISLNNSKTKKKVIVPIATFGSTQTGDLKITTTSAGKRVAIDGVVVRP